MKQLEVALSDYDAEKLKNIKLEDDLKAAQDIIQALQENLTIARNKRRELCEKMQNENDGKETLSDLMNKLKQENMTTKNEMQDMTMRFCKEIEDRKKNEEDLTRRLNDAANENTRLSYENDMLKTDLMHAQNNSNELMRQKGILEGEMDTANQHKEKFKKSSEELGDLLKNQKLNGDTNGLGFEAGENSGTANTQDQGKPVRQPTAYKFNGKCFNYNKYGHRANQCRSRNYQNTNTPTGQCSKCNKVGHNSKNCRMNVRCYVCGRFGHLSNQCRTQTGIGYGKAIQKNNVTCYAYNKIGHIAKFCRSKSSPVNNKGPSLKGKEKVEEVKQDFSRQWIKKSNLNGDRTTPPLAEHSNTPLAEESNTPPVGDSSSN